MTAADVVVTVSDNDTASTAVKLTVDPSTVNEAAGATSVTVTGTLNHAPNTAATEVTVAVSGATASALRGDFSTVVADFTLTIGSGATTGTATFMLTPDNDGVDEDDETVTVGGTAGSLTVTAAELSIADDDTRGITVTPTTLTVPEGDSRTYTVVLESEPTGAVTVTPRVEGNSDVTVSPAALTFTATTWETEQEVTVDADEDDDAEQDAATVKHTVTGGDYGEVTAADVVVTVSDNDTASTAVKLTVDPSRGKRGRRRDQRDGDRSAEPRAEHGRDGSDGDGEWSDPVTQPLRGQTTRRSKTDFTLTIGSGATTGTATFMLTPDNDGVDEDDETVTVGGTAGSLTVTAAELSIADDDTRGIDGDADHPDGAGGRQQDLHGGAEERADRRGDGDAEGGREQRRDGVTGGADVYRNDLGNRAGGDGRRRTRTRTPSRTRRR